MRLQFSLAIALAMLGAAAAFADPQLRGATLPSARTVPITATATAFFTVLNSGTTDATNCSVATSTYVGSELNAYIITSQLVENGVAVGTQSPSFTIPASGRVDMVVGVARDLNGSFNTEANIFFRVDCDGGFSSPAWPGVNSLQVQFLNDAPDIIMIADTITRDGIAGFNGNRTALVAIAAVNIGAASAASDSPNAPAANEANWCWKRQHRGRPHRLRQRGSVNWMAQAPVLRALDSAMHLTAMTV